MSKKIYVAGPMRGRYEFNFPAFIDAAEMLRAHGHEVFNPADRDLENGFQPWGMKGTQSELDHVNFDLREAIAADVDFILRESDAVFVLPEWWDSTGAILEVIAAKFVGSEIINVQPGDYLRALKTIIGRYLTQ